MIIESVLLAVYNFFSTEPVAITKPQLPTVIIMPAKEQKHSVNKIYKSITAQGQTRYDIQLDNTITHTLSDYADVLGLLNTANNKAIVVIHLAGTGGSAEVSEVLSNAIKKSRALVIASVDGSVYSAHAFLALATHYVHFSASSGDFMIHTARLVSEQEQGIYRAACKSPDFLKLREAKRVCEQEEQYIRKEAAGIFTEKEIKRILAGEDVTLDISDVKERFRKAGRLVE